MYSSVGKFETMVVPRIWPKEESSDHRYLNVIQINNFDYFWKYNLKFELYKNMKIIMKAYI